ncbi:MAG TPA: nucleotidyltransferase family protein [Aliidongia sp.]|nr:nucleotidyltransferase family protein [Aliidongia sp.]
MAESRLLLACLRADRAKIQALLAGPIDWAGFVQLSLDHGVTALSFRHLLAHHRDSVPDEIAEAAAAFQAESARQARRGVEDLFAILDRLDAIGVPAVPLKGPMLADLLYGDLALRPFRDLDFLIHETDIAPCLAVLADLGYRPRERLNALEARAQQRYAGEVIRFRGEDRPVEPHWAFAPHTMAVPFDYDALWLRVRTSRLEGRAVLALDPGDLLLSLVIHGAKEQWSQLKWLCDLAALLRRHPELDWEDLFDRARRQGCARMLRLGLALVHSVLALDVPAAALADPVALRLAADIRARLFQPGYEPPSIFHLCRFGWELRERRRDRLRYFLRTIATPRVQHFGIVKLPASLFFAYVPIKLVHDYVLLPLWLAVKRARARPIGL